MSFSDREGVIWFDGRLVPWRDATVHVLTHSLHYGLAVFEGIRAYKTEAGPAIFRLQDHTRRLFQSAHILGLKLPYDEPTINEACCTVMRENDLGEGYIRPLAFLGSEGMGLRADNLTVHVAVAAWEWGAYLGAAGMEKGIRVRTSSFSRHSIGSVMGRAKATGYYVNSIMALKEALDTGYDEALMLDASGCAAEGSGENLFVVQDGAISTPDLTNVLPGITRDSVIALAREAGYSVSERRITRDAIYIADEAFFTGTAAEVTPIRELDGRAIGSGEPGPITRTLQELFFDLAHGRSEAHSDWLTVLS